MRSRIPDEEWDRAWAEFDGPAQASTPAAAPVAAEPRPRPVVLVALTAVMILVSATTQSVSRDQLPQGAARQSFVSLSPAEAELPPVELSVGRLANESALAACWVLALLPQGGGCSPASAR